MADLIREGSAPASIMRRAALGELSLPASEAIEILVSLAGDRNLGADAEQTLEGWDEPSLLEVALHPSTPVDVLTHLFRCFTRRSLVIEALCGNSSLPVAELESAARHAGVNVLRAMTQSPRVRSSSSILESMASNPAAKTLNLAELLDAAQRSEAKEATAKFMAQHAEEIARDDAQLFELVAGPEGDDDPLDQLLTRVKKGETDAKTEEFEQLSVLQKVGRMRVGERIKLAVRGNREERMVLIRDRSKLVAMAVLESPKVNESEMEGYAAMKNVQEAVLRAISTKRKYIKNYGVVKALVNNPKTPIDVALPLLAHLLIKDLRAIAINKNVNETVRKLAIKMFRVKTERKS